MTADEAFENALNGGIADYLPTSLDDWRHAWAARQPEVDYARGEMERVIKERDQLRAQVQRDIEAWWAVGCHCGIQPDGSRTHKVACPLVGVSQLRAELVKRDEALADLASKQDSIDELRAELAALEDAKSLDSINGDCIMLMRGHLARVGIESTFADDAADLAAQTIEKLRAEIERLTARSLMCAECGRGANTLRNLKCIDCVARGAEKREPEGDQP